jgi:hypothetical protein
MANVPVKKDDGSTTVYLSASGAGSDGDPFIPAHSITAIVPGVAATSLGKAEDAAHSSGDVGVMALAVRADTAAATGANSDYVPLLTDATGRLHVTALPSFSGIEGGLTELVGEDEAVAQNQYGGSVGVALAATCAGVINQITLISGENGDGAILKPSGVLYIFDADPTIAVADTAMTAAEWATVIARIPFSASDWSTGDTAGAVANPSIGLPVTFHSLANLYFVWFHTLATGFNDNAAHNESLDMNFWYDRVS